MYYYCGILLVLLNFGYELLLKRVDDSGIEGLDFSQWCCVFNGVELVSLGTVRCFIQRFVEVGFKLEVMMLVYGLAELFVGFVFSFLYQKVCIDCVKCDYFSYIWYVKVVDKLDSNVLCFVICGQFLFYYKVCIVGSDDKELDEWYEGILQFCGFSVIFGYFWNLEEMKKLFSDKWLDSGDLVYIVDGYIYVIG